MKSSKIKFSLLNFEFEGEQDPRKVLAVQNPLPQAVVKPESKPRLKIKNLASVVKLCAVVVVLSPSLAAIAPLPPLVAINQAVEKAPPIRLVRASLKIKKALTPKPKSSQINEDQTIPKKGTTIAGFSVTSPHGMRTHPVTGQRRMHPGVDLDTPTGTPVYVPEKKNTKVKIVCFWDSRGGGKVGQYDSPSRGFKVQVLHLSQCSPGEKTGGEEFAKTGNTGLSTGPHLDVRAKSPNGSRPKVTKGLINGLLTGKQ